MRELEKQLESSENRLDISQQQLRIANQQIGAATNELGSHSIKNTLDEMHMKLQVWDVATDIAPPHAPFQCK